MHKHFDKELGVDIQNTRAMSMDPESPLDYASLSDITGGDVKCLLVMRGSVFQQFVNYPIMVEVWPWTATGRVRREFAKAFTQAERNKIQKFYGRFYRWHLVSGVPHRVAVQPKTLRLLQRAVTFFVKVRDGQAATV